jgi:hypothetical protein
MLVERLTFRARYGRGDELVALFKEPAILDLMRQQGAGPARIYTDATGPMFTVQFEQEIADWETWARFMSQETDTYGTKQFQEWFGRMMELCESGDRQLFNLEKV